MLVIFLCAVMLGVCGSRPASAAERQAALVELRRAPDGFDWRRERYEFVSDRLAIDLLFGGEGG